MHGLMLTSLGINSINQICLSIFWSCWSDYICSLKSSSWTVEGYDGHLYKYISSNGYLSDVLLHFKQSLGGGPRFWPFLIHPLLSRPWQGSLSATRTWSLASPSVSMQGRVTFASAPPATGRFASGTPTARFYSGSTRLTR